MLYDLEGEDLRQVEIQKGGHCLEKMMKMTKMTMRVLGEVALEEHSLFGKGQMMTAVMRAGDDSSWVSI